MMMISESEVSSSVGAGLYLYKHSLHIPVHQRSLLTTSEQQEILPSALKSLINQLDKQGQAYADMMQSSAGGDANTFGKKCRVKKAVWNHFQYSCFSSVLIANRNP